MSDEAVTLTGGQPVKDYRALRGLQIAVKLNIEWMGFWVLLVQSQRSAAC